MLVALALLPLYLGCPKRVPPLPEERIEDPERLLELTEAVEAAVVSVKGEGRLALDTPQGKGQVTLFGAAARPDLLHLEILDFFGRPQAILVAAGGRFYVYQEGRAYRGPATAANMARVFPLALPPEELVALLLGQAPQVPTAAPMSLAVDTEAGAYLVQRAGDGGRTQTLWVDPWTYRVMRSVIEEPGGGGEDVFFRDFQTMTAESGMKTVFPKHVGVSTQGGRVRAELRYTHVALNEELDPSLFDVEPPEGVPVFEIGGGEVQLR